MNKLNHINSTCKSTIQNKRHVILAYSISKRFMHASKVVQATYNKGLSPSKTNAESSTEKGHQLPSQANSPEKTKAEFAQKDIEISSTLPTNIPEFSSSTPIDVKQGDKSPFIRTNKFTNPNKKNLEYPKESSKTTSSYIENSVTETDHVKKAITIRAYDLKIHPNTTILSTEQEHTIIASTDQANKTIGFAIATSSAGNSSLSQANNIKINNVKIDGSYTPLTKEISVVNNYGDKEKPYRTPAVIDDTGYTVPSNKAGGQFVAGLKAPLTWDESDATLNTNATEYFNRPEHLQIIQQIALEAHNKSTRPYISTGMPEITEEKEQAVTTITMITNDETVD